MSLDIFGAEQHAPALISALSQALTSQGFPPLPGADTGNVRPDMSAQAIFADNAAALAVARAWTSKKLKMATAQKDRSAAITAVSVAKKLPSSPARVSAAQAAFNDAAARANPSDVYSHHLVNSWKAALARAQSAPAVVGRNPQPPQAPKGMPQVPGLPSFWTQDDDKADAAQADMTAAITADQNAAFAVARAWTTGQFGGAGAKADKAAAAAAVAALKRVPGSAARTQAAQDALNAALDAIAQQPGHLDSGYRQNLANAWKAVLAKAQAAQPAVAVQSSPSSVGESMDGLDCFGCDEIGFDMSSLGPLFQAGGGMASGAISDYEKDEAKKKASAADKAAADKAIAADVTATMAAAKAGASAQLKQPSAQIDSVAASNAAQAQDRAAASLSAGAAELRAHAADDALNAAVAKAQANPKDVYAQALVTAATATLNKAQNRQILTGDASKSRGGSDEGGSWLTKHSIVKALPNYGTVGVGAGLVGGIWWAVKRFF